MQKIILILLLFCFNSISYSQAADEYFRTLRNDKVNLRQGPSFEYPIKIIYKKKFLPILIQDSFDNFRKVRDHENNTGWIHISQLSKKKAAIVISDNEIMFKNSTIFSNPVAILKEGRFVKIKKCKELWCKVETNNYKGWIKRDSLWGLL
jgi:SH3-like domain-containing protein|tara:strand:- start:6 stop:455 length:450 start_codon:yes stop_codon:yes gene_type:complete